MKKASFEVPPLDFDSLQGMSSILHISSNSFFYLYNRKMLTRRTFSNPAIENKQKNGGVQKVIIFWTPLFFLF
ncbi:hypothetical protein D8M03_14505 [Lysinibacillus endophyticus]|uniref:Uncharacterized protein n=1 Tax=Ureibacillus endophyticus TaxID=1978490 RepID=A0A494YVE6_9BACL|nr:hypothetical protein D8M03_14505 [Lysinibacillus endophyticus]